MAPNPKIKRACNAMKLIGIQEAKVKSVLKKLLKTYDNNWDFIQDENYKVLLDAILDEEADVVATETKKKEEKKESKAVATKSGTNKAPTQMQPVAKIGEDEEDEDEDEIPLIMKRLHRKQEREDKDEIPLIVKRLHRRQEREEEPKHTQPEEQDEDDDMTELPPLKRYLRERAFAIPVYNNASPSFSNPMQMEPEEVPPVIILPADCVQSKKGSDSGTITINNDTGKCSAPMLDMEESKVSVEEWDGETEGTINDTTATNVHPSAVEESNEHKVAAEFVLASSSSGEAKISLSFNSATGETTNLHLPSMEDLRRAMEEKCLRSYKILHPGFSILGFMKDMCSCYIDLVKNSPNQIERETVYGMSTTGDESSAADISMGLVVIPECEISADGWGAISNVKDITVGIENIEIPWVNEINDEVPSRFHYIPQSVVSQDAAVKFSLSSFTDEQCCSLSCIEDCLASEFPCNCAIVLGNWFAYTVDGVVKEDFLEERISEARDQRKQVLKFCEECPLQKGKKEEILEPCKGHLKRKAIKECWINCGCTKTCGNRLVQRGLHNKLQVFFTPNGKGWGLRTLEKLPQGAFVCEYIGEIMTILELYQRSSKDKLISPVILDANWCSEEVLEDNKALCLDGTRYGNISRFLNHRCLDANLIEIPVLVETPYQHYYHLAFFTTRHIEAMEELTWDYGIDFDDDDYLMKPFDCLCGSRFCRNKKRSKKAN